MLFETVTMGKPFLTIFTQIRFLLSVSSGMYFQVFVFVLFWFFFCGKPLLTIFTLKRFLLGVYSDMRL